MLKKVLNAFLIVASLFSLIQPISFAQDVSPTANRMRLKKLQIIGINSLIRIREWVKTGDSSSVAFIEDFSQSTGTIAIYGLPISSKGKAGTPIKYLKVVDGWFDKPSVIWIPEYNRGLIFVPSIQDSEHLNIIVVPFDKNGKKLGAPVSIKSFNPPANNRVQLSKVKIVRGNDSIGVFIGISFWWVLPEKYHISESAVYYLKTDLSGKLTGKSIKIPLPGEGKLRDVFISDAAFDNGRFLVPVTISQYETYNSAPPIELGRPVDSSIFILSAPERKPKASKISLKLMNTSTNSWFIDGYIIPDSENMSNLFYGILKSLPKAKVKLDAYKVDYYNQIIDSNGSKNGKAKRIKAPVWQHQITYDPDRNVRGYSYDSTGGIMANDGTYFVAQIFCLFRITSEVPEEEIDYEQLFRVLNIDPKSGKVEVAAERADTRNLFFSEPLMINFGKNLAILNQGDPFMSRGSAAFGYYSKVRSKIPFNQK